MLQRCCKNTDNSGEEKKHLSQPWTICICRDSSLEFAIIHFFSEMLPREPGNKLLTNGTEIFRNPGWIGKEVILRKVSPFSRKKFTGMTRTIWIHPGITDFSMQMVSAFWLRSISASREKQFSWSCAFSAFSPATSLWNLTTVSYSNIARLLQREIKYRIWVRCNRKSDVQGVFS